MWNTKGMSQLSDYASMDRNPIQESDYQKMLTDANIPFTVDNGKANVTGFGTGGNGTGDSARAFFDQGGQQASQDQTNYNNLVASNNKAVTDFLGNYKTDVTNAQSTANNMFHIPTFENLVTGLTSRINDLEFNGSNSGGGSTGNTGAGGFSDAAQVDEALSSRYLPNLNTAEANLNTGEGLAQQYISNELQPDQAYGQLLATNIQTSMQGLTATQQTEMQGIITKLQTGTQLSVAEMQTGEAYAQAVLQNANNITLQQLKNQYQTVPAGSYLINTLGANPGNVFYGA